MGYGVGGLLLAVGLILALAVHYDVSGIDLHLVGWILAGVGVFCLAVTAFTVSRRGTTRIDR